MLLLTEAWLTLVWVDLVISFTPYRRWRHWLQLQGAGAGAAGCGHCECGQQEHAKAG
ncbi:MAG: hypothetical protein IPO20_19445 [Gammaproteobacteria bacterium]|nr:hypothetical protein [Gammaproteobacteria bacterium]